MHTISIHRPQQKWDKEGFYLDERESEMRPCPGGDSSLIGEAFGWFWRLFFAIGAHNKTSAPWLNESLEAFRGVMIWSQSRIVNRHYSELARRMSLVEVKTAIVTRMAKPDVKRKKEGSFLLLYSLFGSEEGGWVSRDEEPKCHPGNTYLLIPLSSLQNFHWLG